MTGGSAPDAGTVPRPHLVGRAWPRSAACRAHPLLPPSTWDTEVEGQRSRTQRRRRVDAARRVCLTCPVAEPCLQEFLDGYGGGIRAGYEFPDESNFEGLTRAELTRERGAA